VDERRKKEVGGRPRRSRACKEDDDEHEEDDTGSRELKLTWEANPYGYACCSSQRRECK
jgi:hypothetical protein